MSSIDCTKRTVIRVKRRADEEKSIANKRCKFVGTLDSGLHTDICHLLRSQQTVPQSSGAEDREETEDQRIEICDYEDICDSDIFGLKSDEIITCNGKPLESLVNQLNESFDYLYDIYVFDNNQTLEAQNQSQYREYEESDEDSNDENYAYNDYPDDHEVSDDVIDFYSYRDDETDSQTDLRKGFQRNNISSDYDSNDEDIDAFERYKHKNQLSDDSEEEND